MPDRSEGRVTLYQALPLLSWKTALNLTLPFSPQGGSRETGGAPLCGQWERGLIAALTTNKLGDLEPVTAPLRTSAFPSVK